MLPELPDLPPTMYLRARWARQTILDNPQLAEIDEDELLAWVFNKEDGIWYSIAGNYSRQSPKEKMKKRRERLEKNKKWQEKYEQTRVGLLAEQAYYSEIRKAILERDNHTCQVCHKKILKLQVHHIVKQKEGRIDADDNLITACHRCHRKLDGKEYGLYGEVENE